MVEWRVMADALSNPGNEAPVTAGDATLMLQRLAGGDSTAVDELLPLVYQRLRALAGSYFQGQPSDQTLQPTALVHEAYLKLVNQANATWESRAHFFALAATAMRQILQDRARRRRTAKRGGDWERVSLDNVPTPVGGSMVDLVALDDTLTRLSELDARQCRIVELRFFGGLTVPEIAHVLDVSTRTIEKEWRRIRAWLSRELSGGTD